MNQIIEQLFDRAERAKEDSDFTYFFTLLLAGEALAKTVILGMISSIADDRDRNRYRLEHSLVKADGIGDWGNALEDAVTGPASQYLLAEARSEQTDLTRLCKEGDWQYQSLTELKAALDGLSIPCEELPIKSDMKRWFRLFATLRNKTRGHGAIHPTKASQIVKHIEISLRCIYENFSLFKRPWAYLHRNYSGKYRISIISNDSGEFDFLKASSDHLFENGVYIFIGAPRYVPLIMSDAELIDFYFPNGGFNGKKYELLSYYSDDKISQDAKDYNTPPGSLPKSETEGLGELVATGKCFTNAPELNRDYVDRNLLEAQLFDLLMDDRRAIVTLVGKGGIGKTSLTLKVLQKVFQETRFDAVIWLSSRDVDLQISGPKHVRTLLFTPQDMGKLYAKLVLAPEKLSDKSFNSLEYFQQQLENNELGSVLYIFDNFETTQNPIEVFNWIDTYIRLPNKALITTRLREFKGDYPLEITGMEEEESVELIRKTADILGISKLINEKYISDLIHKAEGHPYVMKILLGEVAKDRKVSDIKRIVAGSSEILTALFERTYSALSPCAQRAFMTLAAWSSSVPRIALEAVLMRSIPERDEIEKGVQQIIQYSLAELHYAPQDSQEFIMLPLVASIFGRQKLNVSTYKTAIQVDVETLQMLGTSVKGDVHLGLAKRLEKFISNVSKRIESGEEYETYSPVLEMICRNYNPGWLILARWHLESNDKESMDLAQQELRRYLEHNPYGDQAAEAWRMLGDACYQAGDSLGQIHALIERAQISDVPFHDVSNTANRLNLLLRQHDLNLEIEEKRILAQRIASVLDERRNEADADDYSRMAWLQLHLGKEIKAKEYAEHGLNLDENNQHCKKILERPFARF